jgi:hypothetical protein
LAWADADRLVRCHHGRAEQQSEVARKSSPGCAPARSCSPARTSGAPGATLLTSQAGSSSRRARPCFQPGPQHGEPQLIGRSTRRNRQLTDPPTFVAAHLVQDERSALHGRDLGTIGHRQGTPAPEAAAERVCVHRPGGLSAGPVSGRVGHRLSRAALPARDHLDHAHRSGHVRVPESTVAVLGESGYHHHPFLDNDQ